MRSWSNFPWAPTARPVAPSNACATLPCESVRLRTRALTTTLFSRFLLGDLFIHGIGGSKYDELGRRDRPPLLRNRAARRSSPFRSPSGSAYRPRPNAPDPSDLERRTAQPSPSTRTANCMNRIPMSCVILIRKKQELIAGPVSTHRERKSRCLAIRACNEAMQPWVRGLEARLLAAMAKARCGSQSNRVAGSREFAFVLHSADRAETSFAVRRLAPFSVETPQPVRRCSRSRPTGSEWRAIMHLAERPSTHALDSSAALTDPNVMRVTAL